MLLRTASWVLPSKKTRRPLSRSFSSSRVFRQLTPFTRRLLNLPEAPPPAPSQQNHRDLHSFLSHAKRTGLPETSTTFIGTRYEYTVQSSLRRFAFDLTRIGGRDDAGIDLVGTWHLPGREFAPIRIVAQCKALRTKLGPNLVRELEGAFRHSPVGWRTSDKLAVLVSPREATKGVRDTLTTSPHPLLWMTMTMTMESSRGGGVRGAAVKQVLWNSKAEENLGLGALGVEMRYPQLPAAAAAATATATTTATAATAPDERPRPDVVLTWDGNDIPDMECVEDKISRKEADWLAGWGCQDLSEEQKHEFLTLLQRSYPELGRGAIFDDATGDYAEKKAQFLLLLKEKFLR